MQATGEVSLVDVEGDDGADERRPDQTHERDPVGDVCHPKLAFRLQTRAPSLPNGDVTHGVF